jgi:hypothetical protein
MEKIYEELKVLGKDLADRVGELLHQGNVHRVIIKNDKGHTFMEVPLTVAAIGTIFAPVLAAVGALAGMAAHFTVGVERTTEPPAPAPPPPPPPDAV